jgi:hypothetical protein
VLGEFVQELLDDAVAVGAMALHDGRRTSRIHDLPQSLDVGQLRVFLVPDQEVLEEPDDGHATVRLIRGLRILRRRNVERVR